MSSSMISVSCKRSNLRRVRSFVGDALVGLRLPDLVVNQLILAVDEICANFIIHTNKEDSNKILNVELNTLPSEVVFKISTEGLGYEFNKYKEPVLRDLISNGRKGGVGILLVNRIMDKVTFTTEGAISQCIMHKKLPLAE